MNLRRATPRRRALRSPQVVACVSALTISLLLATTAWGQPPEEAITSADTALDAPWMASLSLSYGGHFEGLRLGPERQQARTVALASARLAWWAHPRLAFEGELRTGETTFEDLKGSLMTVGGRAQALVTFWSGAWRPYVLAGRGRDRLLTQGTGFGDNNRFTATHLGLGILGATEGPLQWRVELRAALHNAVQGRDLTGGVEGGVGLIYAFP